MPHVGSALATAAKVSSDFLYQKEWSKATARLKSICTVGEHEIGKLTLPNAAASTAPCSCWARADDPNRTQARYATKRHRFEQDMMYCFLSQKIGRLGRLSFRPLGEKP